MAPFSASTLTATAAGPRMAAFRTWRRDGECMAGPLSWSRAEAPGAIPMFEAAAAQPVPLPREILLDKTFGVAHDPIESHRPSRRAHAHDPPGHRPAGIPGTDLRRAFLRRMHRSGKAGVASPAARARWSAQAAPLRTRVLIRPHASRG